MQVRYKNLRIIGTLMHKKILIFIISILFGWNTFILVNLPHTHAHASAESIMQYNADETIKIYSYEDGIIKRNALIHYIF